MARLYRDGQQVAEAATLSDLLAFAQPGDRAWTETEGAAGTTHTHYEVVAHQYGLHVRTVSVTVVSKGGTP